MFLSCLLLFHEHEISFFFSSSFCVNFFLHFLTRQKKSDHVISASSGQNRAGLAMTGHVPTASHVHSLMSVSSPENAAMFLPSQTSMPPCAKSQPYALKLQRVFVFLQEKAGVIICESFVFVLLL
jgi:hypothetical protein